MKKIQEQIPELAGVATYPSAARIGYTVDENVQRLRRLHWTERRLMEVMLAHLNSTPRWEVKCAMALHQWCAAEHAEWLRERITEMRHPAPPLNEPPDDALDAFLEEVLRARTTDELLIGIYGVALPALRDAYYRHIHHTNPLVDHPTISSCASPSLKSLRLLPGEIERSRLRTRPRAVHHGASTSRSTSTRPGE